MRLIRSGVRGMGSNSFFLELITRLNSLLRSRPLPEQLKLIWEHSKLSSAYEEDSLDKRLENIEELIRVAEECSDTQDFLARASFADETFAPSEVVQFMTVHASKGLEFKSVFLVGLEEALFPHKISVHEGLLQEERRLCYVAVTRAKQQLTLSYVQKRYGRPAYKSRFISELLS